MVIYEWLAGDNRPVYIAEWRTLRSTPSPEGLLVNSCWDAVWSSVNCLALSDNRFHSSFDRHVTLDDTELTPLSAAVVLRLFTIYRVLTGYF